jgi:heat shock protein HslJ
MEVGEDGTVGGFAGVNSWGASLDIDRLAHGEFEMAPAHTTLMAGPPEAMDLERRFLDALQAAEHARVGADGALTLRGADDQELLRFVPAG